MVPEAELLSTPSVKMVNTSPIVRVLSLITWPPVVSLAFNVKFFATAGVSIVTS